MSTIVNYLSVTTVTLAILGLSIHDTHIDKAIVKVVSPPSVILTNDHDSETILSKMLVVDHHIHIDSNSFGSSTLTLRSHQPSIQPKVDDDKKYIASKRLKNSAVGNSYIWPSI